jgi:ribosome small subunit-dependent GTPase A
VVGDWVALSVPDGDGASLIEAVLARRNAIVRSDAGRTSEVQALAANVDTVFVVHPIADEPNLRRLERELSVAWSSGAVPVVVLTKSDLSDDAEAACEAVEDVAIGVEIVPVNGLDGVGVAGLMAHVAAGRTAILLGPSGAGKSTLINALLGEKRLATGGVRENDGRGRHTTVARELVAIPGHGVIIDTPGLRAIGLTGDEDGIALAFPDIEALAPHVPLPRLRARRGTGLRGARGGGVGRARPGAPGQLAQAAARAAGGRGEDGCAGAGRGASQGEDHGAGAKGFSEAVGEALSAPAWRVEPGLDRLGNSPAREPPMKILIETAVDASAAEAWRAWTTPADIVCWNTASPDWHTTSAELDLRVGGKFTAHMAAKDGSMGFDFSGTYTRIIAPSVLEYVLDDGRAVLVEFVERPGGVTVRETFEAESENDEELQRTGWQAILDNFARHVVAARRKS